MNEIIKNAIPLIPHKSGVYLMKNVDNEVIYVGKAKDLFNRVSQYFLRPQVGKVFAMVRNVHHFETIITQSEKEAFLLEENLIHKYYPRYNILLKDDKHYPYIALKRNGDPILKIARDDKNKSFYYFGPFPTSTHAYKVIDLLNKLFPLRKCKNIPSTPCLYYHLGQCVAPCINKIDEKIYEQLRIDIKSFLDGKNEAIENSIKSKMLEFSNNLEFEKAQEQKELLDSIHHILDKQGVDNIDNVSRDVFSFIARDGYLSLALLTYRNKSLLGKQVFIVEQFGDEKEQICELICQYYAHHSLPDEILCNLDNLKEYIAPLFDVRVNNVEKGKLFQLIEIATLNARQELDNHFASARLDDDKISLLNELGELLNIKTPYHIELFDNSHLQGDSPVGALVCFINGEPNKKMYRKYNLTEEEAQNDTLAMQHVLKRRYTRLLENNEKMPDLIIVDGGINQLRSGEAALKEINVNIPLVGLFKNDHHQTKGIITSDEKIFLLEDNKKLFFMLVRMQDEVHRFAITSHIKKRNKSFLKGILDDVNGLGEKRKELIRKHYPSFDDLKKASLDEFRQLLPKDVAKNLYDKINNLGGEYE